MRRGKRLVFSGPYSSGNHRSVGKVLLRGHQSSRAQRGTPKIQVSNCHSHDGFFTATKSCAPIATLQLIPSRPIRWPPMRCVPMPRSKFTSHLLEPDRQRTEVPCLILRPTSGVALDYTCIQKRSVSVRSSGRMTLHPSAPPLLKRVQLAIEAIPRSVTSERHADGMRNKTTPPTPKVNHSGQDRAPRAPAHTRDD